MATPLDIGLLQNFSIIFPFLLVLVFVYGVLSMTKIFGDNKGVYAFLAFILAVSTLFSPIAIKTINLMAPWFVLLFIFSIFLLIAYQTFGIKEESILKTITSKDHGDTFFYWVLFLVLAIGLGSLSFVVSEERGFKALAEQNETGAVQQGTEQTGFWQTLFHPKILGMILIMLIAVFTVKQLASYK
ncbi:hypothetical protein HY493_02000 [Candidatus Woesearchaeota archaeon]|nr:hypothetical protein [Candidatus Woesearchaeota archaeon]